jgi:hypothetical protein
VGNRVEGWRDEYATMTVAADMTNVAARLGNYENALCTVAATLGVIGLAMFVRIGVWIFGPVFRHLRRHGVLNPEDALVFVAAQGLFIYLAFCWIAGSYPASTLLWGTVAAACVSDRARTGQPCGS